MNAIPGMHQPPEGTGSTNNASRRTFLKGVGLAGAAGLAAPFLSSTSARACSPSIPGCTLNNVLTLGVNAPNPWESPPTTLGQTWPDLVKGALGCRSYRSTPFNVTGSSTVAAYTDPDALGNPPKFPGEPGTIPLASIRPDPTALLNGDLDTVLTKFIQDGASRFSLPQLTVWHEAGHLYSSSDFSQYGLDPKQVNGTPQNAAAAQTVRSMHAHMQNLCRKVGGVQYGCIIYGDIAKMANINDLRDATNWVPTSGYPLDWYGIDVYYEGDGTGTDCTHGILSDYSAVANYLDGYLAVVQDRAPGAPINICECNANDEDANFRPGFFKNLAQWLSTATNGRTWSSMLTFFHTVPAGTEAPHSVPWNPPATPDQGTIDALKYIQSTYG